MTTIELKCNRLPVAKWLVDLKYYFECDWPIELSNNKLSDKNLTSELVKNKSFLNQWQWRKL